jgi:hypothetical protein
MYNATSTLNFLSNKADIIETDESNELEQQLISGNRIKNQFLNSDLNLDKEIADIFKVQNI